MVRLMFTFYLAFAIIAGIALACLIEQFIDFNPWEER